MTATPALASTREELAGLLADARGTGDPFGTGAGRFPVDEAARIMVGAAREHAGGLERIVFAVHGEEAKRAFRAQL